VLDAVKRPPQHEQRDADRGQRDAEVAADAGEQVESGCDAGELGAQRAEVGNDQCAERKGGAARPEMIADEREQALLGHHAHAGTELVEDDQSERRDREHPQQAIAELGAEDRVGGDPGGVVIGEPGQHARPDDREQRRHPAGTQQPPAAPDQMPVKMTPRRTRARSKLAFQAADDTGRRGGRPLRDRRDLAGRSELR
jgi:hypothetical protein